MSDGVCDGIGAHGQTADGLWSKTGRVQSVEAKRADQSLPLGGQSCGPGIHVEAAPCAAGQGKVTYSEGTFGQQLYQSLTRAHLHSSCGLKV